MENNLNLESIISKESEKGEKITLDEIRNLDKEKLAQTLSSIDNQTKSVLLNSLKDLIKTTLPTVKNLSDNSPNNQIIVLAMQIFGNLSGMKIEIDGKFSDVLMSNEFKNLYLNSQKSKTTMLEKLNFPIEELSNSKNLGDFLNTTLEVLLRSYVKKLNSSEGVPLDPKNINIQLIILLQEIDKNLPTNNIFKGNTKIIIDNFLTPAENGQKLISGVIEKVLNQKEEKVKQSDVEVLKITLKGGIGTLIDVAKTQSPEKLKSYINEFKNIPKIKEYIDKIPEFDKIIDLIISLTKTLDKNEINNLLDNFFSKNTNNLLLIANKKPGEQIEDKVKLQIVNDAWRVIDGLINQERISISLEKLAEFDFLKSNNLLKQVFEIINDKSKKLSNEDKYKLFKSISSLLLITTSPSGNIESHKGDIKIAINNIINLISKFNKEGKIDEKKVVDLIRQFVDNGEKTSVIEKLKKIKSVTEFGSLIVDNYDTLKTYLLSSSKGRDGLEDAIREFIRNNKLSENIKNAGGNFIERIEEAFKLNTADMILSIRDTIINLNISSSEKKSPNKIENQKAAYDIGSVFVEKISKKGFELIKQKLNSSNNSQKSINKDDLINIVFAGVSDVFNDKNSKKIIFENATKLGVKIDNKEQFVQNLVSNIVNNPEFKNIINSITTILFSRLSNAKDISLELDNIKNDINKLVSDFTLNYKKDGINGLVKTFNETKILNQETKLQIVKTSIDFSIDYFKNLKNVEVLLQAFPEIKSKLPTGISEEQVTKILTGFLNSIPKDLIFQILTQELKNGFDINNFKKPENIINLFNKILSSADVNKDLILQNIIDLQLGKIAKKTSEKIILNQSILENGVNTLYSLLGNANEEKINELGASLGLDKVFSSGINTTLKNIPSEILKKNLILNIDFVNEAANGNIDMNKGLKFVSELYKDIPVGNRLNVVSDLISNFDKNSGNKVDFKLDNDNSKYITNIIYSTIETNALDKLSPIISKIIPGITEILSRNDFGNKDNLSNGISLLKSIPKENFLNFLVNNSQKINTLMLSSNKALAIDLAVELFGKVDGEKLKENMGYEKLSKNEKFGVDILGSVQKSLEKNKDKINELIQTGTKIQKYVESGEKDISKSGLTQNEINDFASNSFDLVNDIINLEINNIMKTENISEVSHARTLLAEKFEIPQSSGKSNIDISKIDIMSFALNNLGFSFKWGLSYLFNGKNYTIKNAGIEMFLDKGKKQDFVNLFNSYFK